MACRFGTFLFNSAADRAQCKLTEQVPSLVLTKLVKLCICYLDSIFVELHVGIRKKCLFKSSVSSGAITKNNFFVHTFACLLSLARESSPIAALNVSFCGR